MCGIVGYVGEKSAVGIIVDGLKRLEYRGYDSAGVAVVRNGTMDLRRSAGKLSRLEDVIRLNPITGDYVQSWIDYFGLTYIVLQDKIVDGQFQLQSFYDENATPLNMVVTTADMKIRYRAVGYSAFQVNYWAKKFMFE